MAIEFTGYFDDLVSGWEMANKTEMSNLVKRCVIKNIVKKDASVELLAEVDQWDGRKSI